MKDLIEKIKQPLLGLVVATSFVGMPNAVMYHSAKKGIEAQHTNDFKLEKAYETKRSYLSMNAIEKTFFLGAYLAGEEAINKYKK